MKTLQKARSGMRSIFKYSDFNLNMLSDWYEKNIVHKPAVEIDRIKITEIPSLDFELILGIDDENDMISSFEDILILDGIESNVDQEDIEVAEITIKIKYEVDDLTAFLQELVEIKTKNLEIEKDNNNLEYHKDLQYRKFLSLFSSDYFILNFYPLGKDEPSKEFSLAPLLKVETIEANTVKSDETLSKAYNKIVSSYIKNNNVTEIDKLVGQMNLKVKNMVDRNIKDILQRSVSSIEATNNLKMNLHPDVTLEKIFINSIIYEYQEGNNNIPESQFGMGYTNLMVIIANIVDYIQLYSKNDINGSVNILCIEEPESFMHPQMQELFIKNIAKAIAILLGKKGQLETFQIIITTHSPHIVNSKIHSGNTLNNIIYLGQSSGNNIIRNLNDKAIIDVSSKDEESKKNYEYIKKYLRLELSDIFFADAIILVEGVSEETYIRYEIDKHSILKNNHIKVYRIDGAYAHQFLGLIGLLGIKTIVYTDLDLKRNKGEKQISIKEGIIPKNITNLKDRYKDTDKPMSTNTTLLHFIKEELKSDNPGAKCINDKIISMLDDEEELIVQYDSAENITLHSQGKINGCFATSFEEAIILTNGESNNDKTYKESLIELLKYVHPNKFEKLNIDIDIINQSYKYQIQLSDGKSKFSTGIVYLSIVEESFSIKVPKYIQSGLDTLVKFFEE
ncbi:AAA family ATPase [Staphylococcus pseudintermedius]|nr:AAA family ATPase [Staphylococcus pseudintermedius]MDT1038620.1 AAA family ATPase [Staphylococcus pseudintermedius]